jgi:predicted Rossmann-fold nucleotide-binding protein
MLDRRPDLVIVFPGGHGTADMTRRAVQWGIPIVRLA